MGPGRDHGPTVVAVRQNLDLLVDHGAAVPGMNRYDIWTWGPTLAGLERLVGKVD